MKSNTLNIKKVAISYISLLLLAGALFYAQNSFAETNATGVEIEIINEPVSGDLLDDPMQVDPLQVDPMQGYLADVDANNQDDLQVDLWSRIKDGYAMPNIESSYTTKHQDWYASHPDYVKRMLERSQKYLFHIVEEVQKRNMPTEIALLPMIESAYNPQANSRSRASGIWQFIPSTGKHFGLKQNWWVDNRRDVTAATNAALDYLQKLHGMFGAWDLALAAYNAGEGTVQRAINHNRAQGLPTDYQSLNLSAETRNYVPKLQAIKNIVTNPENFDLTLNSIPNRPYFARVTTPNQIDAKLAAQLAEITFEEFTSLNPSYNRPVITSQGEKHQLLLPVWAAERFADNLANYDKPLTNWQTYNAKRGERMDNIAQKFGMNVSQLRDVNGLPASNKLRNAQAMLVPAVYNGEPLSNVNEIKSDGINASEMENNNAIDQSSEIEPIVAHNITHNITHKVKKGDTLAGLASKYDTNTKALMKTNSLKSTQLKAGQTIIIKDVVTKETPPKNTRNNKDNKQVVSKTSNHKANSIKTNSIKISGKKISSHTNNIKNKRKTSGHISARSHIRLK